MAFNTGAALLDAIVLAVVAREEHGTYGYKITPVLRRLQKDGCLTVRDEAYNGRNRRYYEVTAAGRTRLAEFRTEWDAYTSQINKLFKGELS